MNPRSNGSEERPSITALPRPSPNSNAVARPIPTPTLVAQTFFLCGSPPNWPRLCDLSACSRALAARFSTLPHRFAFTGNTEVACVFGTEDRLPFVTVVSTFTFEAPRGAGLSSRVHALAALSFARPSPCHFRAVNAELHRTSRVRCHLPRSKCM